MIGKSLLPVSVIAFLGACAYGPPYLDRSFAPADFARRPALVEPLDNPSTPSKVGLGRTLFAEPRLSGGGARSCASCHQTAKGLADGMALGQGVGGRQLIRHTPSLWNVGFASRMFWDGRVGSLEEQALQPVMNGGELARHPAATIDLIRADPAYRARFAGCPRCE